MKVDGEPGPWLTRIAWLVLPFTAGPALATALDPRSTAVRTVATLLLWTGWAGALGASLVPRTATLTAIRIVMPAALPATVWATTVGAPAGSTSWTSVLAVGTAVLVVAAVLSPLTGDAFVDGSSYGNERRFALRAPGAVLVGPAVLAWAAVVAAVVAGPLLLAARQWVAGGLAVVAAAVTARVAVRALQGLARRWVVFVPAGMVLHDPFTLSEPVLFPRRMVARLGPAEAGAAATADAFDGTAGAPGLALRVDVREPTTVGRKDRGGRSSTDVTASGVLFTPTRPGALLREAAGRRLPV